MSDLAKALRKAVECKDKYGEHICYPRNVIEPLWDKVIAVVEAAEQAQMLFHSQVDVPGATQDLVNESLDEALEQLRLAVGEK